MRFEWRLHIHLHWIIIDIRPTNKLKEFMVKVTDVFHNHVFSPFFVLLCCSLRILIIVNKQVSTNLSFPTKKTGLEC